MATVFLPALEKPNGSAFDLPVHDLDPEREPQGERSGAAQLTWSGPNAC